jgi:hypothetical protein
MDTAAAAQSDIVCASIACAVAEGSNKAFVYLDRAMYDEVYDAFAASGRCKDIIYSGDVDYYAATGRSNQNMYKTTIHVYVVKLK